MKGLSFLLMLGLLVSCDVEKISKVKFVHSLNDDAITGQIKVNKSVLKLSGTSGESFDIKPVYPSKVKFNLEYNHAKDFYANSANDLAATEINMSFELENVNKKDQTYDVKKIGSVKLQGKKFKLTSCTNTVDFKVNGSELIIDMSKFKSLSSCKLVGKSKNYSKIGDRRLKNGFGKNFFKYKTDVSLGKSAAEDLIASMRDYIYADGEMAEHLQSMLVKIAKASDSPDIEPKVYFVNAPIENAFALPGGYVFVFRGLIESLETEAELAGVLGHEWSHVTERHGTESVTRSLKSIATKYIGAGLVWANFGILGGAAAYYIYDKIEDIPLMGFSRLQELEADKLGVQYAYAAGYSPYGLSKFFAQMPERNENFVELLNSTHPRPSTRVEKIEELVFNYIPYNESAVVTSDEYQTAKDNMANLEPMPSYMVRRLISSMSLTVNESIKKTIRQKLKLEHKLDER